LFESAILHPETKAAAPKIVIFAASIVMKFSDVAVKQDVKELLLHSARENRVSHALLFSGPEGSAGLPLAIAFACYIHCENKTTSDSCGTCASCVKYRKFIHPDLHFTYPVVNAPQIKGRSPMSSDYIALWREALLKNPYLGLNEWYQALGVENKQGFISVEESSDILRKLSLKPYEAEYKIQLIWLPEKMRAEAANKLLKILEEPPDGTLFLLVTEHRDQLLSTILSRTQLIKVPRPAIAEIASVMTGLFHKDAIVARRIAGIAGSNFHEAFRMATDDHRDLKPESEFMNWMRLCYGPFREHEGKVAWTDLNTWIDRSVREGREYLKSFFAFCIDASRECLLVNQEADSMYRFNDELIPGFSRFTKFIHAGNIAQVYNLLNRAIYAVERNANPRILLLDLSLKMHMILTGKAEATEIQ
jgi:DNA polymerase-3 subunit delta'